MTGTKRIAMLGGAAALTFAVGFGGGVGASALASSTTAATQPAPAAAAAPAAATPGVHYATLTGCVSGLGC